MGNIILVDYQTFHGIYKWQFVETLSSMVHFPFNHLKELELSHNCAKLKVKVWRYYFSEIIVMDQEQTYMDGPRLLRMRLSEYIPQLSTRNVDLVP